jgi:hypothetical protein
MFKGRTPVEVLLIIDGFQPRLMNYIKFLGDTAIIVYAVDKWVFERDVEQGFLGEALAIQLVFPYTPLVNAEYLKAEELKLKKRLILEILENLVLDFPELCYDIHIKPEYFMWEALHDRARLFPPIRYTLSNLLVRNIKEEKVQTVMEGFLQALKILEEEKVVASINGYVKISKDFADAVKKRKIRFTNIFKNRTENPFHVPPRNFSKNIHGSIAEQGFAFKI